MNGNTNQRTDFVVLKVTNLKKKFDQLTAVDSLSFTIYQNEIFGFLGPNGAGKTTSINMICGLCPPTEGKITYFGNERLSKNEIKSQIGICPQENIFWPNLTCLEQMIFMGEMYGLSAQTSRSKSRELLEWMGLQEKAKVLAHQLSGGMKRRLNICLALIHDPKLLILDEPEAGLDPQSRILVRNFIKTIAKEKTIILTTHNMDEADRLADRVAIIDHGKLLLLDTPHHLKKTIGEGDLLEISIIKNNQLDIQNLRTNLLKTFDQVMINNETLFIKSKNMIERISEITPHIQSQGFKINEIKLRENTLEDVFIYLTGRSLRQ